jgi:hypothetical protein
MVKKETKMTDEKQEPKTVTKGEWVNNVVKRCEQELELMPLDGQASAFQALAIMCFQRATELATDHVIDTMDTIFSEEMGVPKTVHKKIVDGVRMAAKGDRQ